MPVARLGLEPLGLGLLAVGLGAGLGGLGLGLPGVRLALLEAGRLGGGLLAQLTGARAALLLLALGGRRDDGGDDAITMIATMTQINQDGMGLPLVSVAPRYPGHTGQTADP